MAKYINKSLEKGEEIILNGRLHWVYIAKFVVSTMLLIILGAAALVWKFTSKDKDIMLYVGLGLLVIALILYFIGRVLRTRSEFAVTNSRFIQKDGIFNVKMTEIPLYKIETVNFYQTFWQRVLQTGSIELVGSGGTSHRVDCIQKPMLVRKTIVGAINNVKEEQE